MDHAVLANISTYSALLPILVGSLAFRKHHIVKWFVAFLFYGFLTDFINSLSDSSSNVIEETTFALFIQNLYSLVDACFLFWFIAQFITEGEGRRILYGLAIAMVPFWVVSSFVVRDVLANGQSLSAYFEVSYEVLLASASAYAILKLVERGTDHPLGRFLWVLIGIFTFNFMIFFLHAFISTEIATQIWFMGNIINIITMLMYAYCFFKIKCEGKTASW